MGINTIPAPSAGGATTPIGATSLLYSGAAPYGGTNLTGLSLAAGTYAIVLNQSNADRGFLSTANNGKFILDGNRPNYVTLTTTETTFTIGGGISNNYANIQLGRSNINGLCANSNDTFWGTCFDEQANGTYRLRTSTDFLNWRSPTGTYPSNYNSGSYIYAQQKRLGPYVGFGRNSTNNNFTFTTDGFTWNTSSLPGGSYYRGSVFDYNAILDRWIAHSDVSFNSTPAGARAAISTNGTTWTEVTATTLGLNSAESYTYGSALSPTATAKYVVTGTAGNTTPRIMSSTDGTTWASRTVPTISGCIYIGNVVWSSAAGKYLAETNVLNTYVLSTDGITWTTQTIDIHSGYPYATSEGFWIYNDAQCKFAWSTNGTTWNIVKRPETSTYFPENGFTANDYTWWLPRWNAKGADRFMSHAQDNNSQYGTNRHVLISWEPLTYMIYSTAIATV